MYIRKLKNRSGSVSIQIISKIKGRYKVVKTVGCATMWHEIEELEKVAKLEIKKLTGQQELFFSEQDRAIISAFNSLNNSNIRTVGPELIFGRIYDYIGLNAIKEEL